MPRGVRLPGRVPPPRRAVDGVVAGATRRRLRGVRKVAVPLLLGAALAIAGLFCVLMFG